MGLMQRHHTQENRGICCQIREGTREYVKKDYQPREGRMSDVYRKLFDVAQQLLAIVKKYREGANKDIRRFTEDIEKLCRRWDK